MGSSRACPYLRIEGIGGQWGSFELAPVCLEVEASDYLVVLGPSGCGKTTLMEILCGLRRPGAGRIFLNGADITQADPADRGIGYLPQDYELFPTKSAKWNIRFAARVKGVRGPDVETRFGEIVDMLDARALLDRDVRTLSGGERQRVALGRALMAEPRILILDEPVSALPESMRDTICGELKKLQARLNLTTLHVSHNLDEALFVATRLAVMDIGKLVQTGAPEEILERPANRFVAEFTQSKNIWPAVVKAGVLSVRGQILSPKDAPDGEYTAVIRPENLLIQSVSTGIGSLFGKVAQSLRTSHTILTKVTTPSFDLWARDDKIRETGADVAVIVPSDSVLLLSPDKGV